LCGSYMERYGIDNHRCLKCGNVILTSDDGNNNYVAENMNG